MNKMGAPTRILSGCRTSYITDVEDRFPANFTARIEGVYQRYDDVSPSHIHADE